MHVPFSMSDEPDLGDEFKQYERELPEPPPMRRCDRKTEPVYTQEQLNERIAAVVRRNIQTIAGYQKELAIAYDTIHRLQTLQSRPLN